MQQYSGWQDKKIGDIIYYPLSTRIMYPQRDLAPQRNLNSVISNCGLWDLIQVRNMVVSTNLKRYKFERPQPRTNIYRHTRFIKSCEDSAMNDKTLKCITMMSHEIKAIYSRALCEKYGNNIALAGKTTPCIWNMWSELQYIFFKFPPKAFILNTNALGKFLRGHFANFYITKRQGTN